MSEVPLYNPAASCSTPEVHLKERMFIELITSGRKLKASIEGSK